MVQNGPPVGLWLPSVAWILDFITLAYFAIYYFEHIPKKFDVVSIQYLTLPIFVLVSANMVFFSYTVVT